MPVQESQLKVNLQYLSWHDLASLFGNIGIPKNSLYFLAGICDFQGDTDARDFSTRPQNFRSVNEQHTNVKENVSIRQVYKSLKEKYDFIIFNEEATTGHMLSDLFLIEARRRGLIGVKCNSLATNADFKKAVHNVVGFAVIFLTQPYLSSCFDPLHPVRNRLIYMMGFAPQQRVFVIKESNGLSMEHLNECSPTSVVTDATAAPPATTTEKNREDSLIRELLALDSPDVMNWSSIRDMVLVSNLLDADALAQTLSVRCQLDQTFQRILDVYPHPITAISEGDRKLVINRLESKIDVIVSRTGSQHESIIRNLAYLQQATDLLADGMYVEANEKLQLIQHNTDQSFPTSAVSSSEMSSSDPNVSSLPEVRLNILSSLAGYRIGMCRVAQGDLVGSEGYLHDLFLHLPLHAGKLVLSYDQLATDVMQYLVKSVYLPLCEQSSSLEERVKWADRGLTLMYTYMQATMNQVSLLRAYKDVIRTGFSDNDVVTSLHTMPYHVLSVYLILCVQLFLSLGHYESALELITSPSVQDGAMGKDIYLNLARIFRPLTTYLQSDKVLHANKQRFVALVHLLDKVQWWGLSGEGEVRSELLCQLAEIFYVQGSNEMALNRYYDAIWIFRRQGTAFPKEKVLRMADMYSRQGRVCQAAMLRMSPYDSQLMIDVPRYENKQLLSLSESEKIAVEEVVMRVADEGRARLARPFIDCFCNILKRGSHADLTSFLSFYRVMSSLEAIIYSLPSSPRSTELFDFSRLVEDLPKAKETQRKCWHPRCGNLLTVSQIGYCSVQHRFAVLDRELRIINVKRFFSIAALREYAVTPTIRLDFLVSSTLSPLLARLALLLQNVDTNGVSPVDPLKMATCLLALNLARDFLEFLVAGLASEDSHSLSSLIDSFFGKWISMGSSLESLLDTSKEALQVLIVLFATYGVEVIGTVYIKPDEISGKIPSSAGPFADLTAAPSMSAADISPAPTALGSLSFGLLSSIIGTSAGALISSVIPAVPSAPTSAERNNKRSGAVSGMPSSTLIETFRQLPGDRAVVFRQRRTLSVIVLGTSGW